MHEILDRRRRDRIERRRGLVHEDHVRLDREAARDAEPLLLAAGEAVGVRLQADVAITTHEHVFEVDPRLMERWVLQQTFPNWDSLRIMNSRGDHLEWMHRHFATKVVTGSELLAEVDAEDTGA